MNQGEIAKRIGISGAHYSCIINEKTPMGKRTAKKIGKLINLEWYDLFKMSGKEIHKAALDALVNVKN